MKTKESIETKNDNKLLNWALLVVLSLAVFFGAGWYAIKNHDKISEEMLAAINQAKTVKETVKNDTTINVTKEITDMDEEISSVLDTDFADTELSDSSLSL